MEGNPTGIFFTGSGDMGHTSHEGAKALAEGEASDLARAYGYHIIQRTALDYENQFINYQADSPRRWGGRWTRLSQWMTEAEVETTGRVR